MALSFTNQFLEVFDVLWILGEQFWIILIIPIIKSNIHEFCKLLQIILEFFGLDHENDGNKKLQLENGKLKS